MLELVLLVAKYIHCISDKPDTHIMPHNFYKYGQILIILSLSYSSMNCTKRWYQIYHLSSNLLLHYLAKIECSTAELLARITYTSDVLQLYIGGVSV